MELHEALALSDRLRPNIAALEAMPDPFFRETAKAALLHTVEVEEASVVLRSDFCNKIGNFILEYTAPQKKLSTEQLVDETKDGNGDNDHAMKYLERLLNSDITCEPVNPLRSRTTFSERVKATADQHVTYLFKEVGDLEMAKQKSAKNLGPKKAKRLQNEYDRLTAGLIAASPEDSNLEHVALDPVMFSAVQNELYKRSIDETLTSNEREVYLKFGKAYLKSGEDFVKAHAEELQKDIGYVSQLITALSDELHIAPSIMGPAYHLSRGYYGSVNTPNQAIERQESILHAILLLYKDAPAVQAGTYLFCLLPPYFEHIEFYENYCVAIDVSGQEDDYTDRAGANHLLHIERMVNKFCIESMENLPVEQKRYITNRTGKLYEVRSTQIASKLSLGNKFEDKQLKYKKRSEYISESERRAKGITDIGNKQGSSYDVWMRNDFVESITSGEYEQNKDTDEYLRITGKLLLKPNKIAQEFMRIFGYSKYALKNRSVQIIDKDLVLDIAYIGALEGEDVLQARYESFLDAVKTYQGDSEGWKLKFYNYNKSDKILPNYGSVPLEIISNDKAKVSIRKITKFDEEVLTETLEDFAVSKFESTQEIPSIPECVEKIERFRTRFVPKRGVQVVITDNLTKKSGLDKLVLRSGGGDRVIVEAIIHGRQRTVQIKNGVFYDNNGDRSLIPVIESLSEISSKFAGYCMYALSEWMCRPKVETSEGTIEEGKDGPIKGGYFSYLRVREADGLYYKRHDKQWFICAEERGLDLDVESERLKQLDKKGKKRNSTYVKEHPDDGGHLDPLKIYL